MDNFKKERPRALPFKIIARIKTKFYPTHACINHAERGISDGYYKRYKCVCLLLMNS